MFRPVFKSIEEIPDHLESMRYSVIEVVEGETPKVISTGNIWGKSITESAKFLAGILAQNKLFLISIATRDDRSAGITLMYTFNLDHGKFFLQNTFDRRITTCL